MPQTLVIGYGNLDRGDDGAAFHVVNRLRRRMGRRALAQDDTGLEELGSETAVFIPQLLPELSMDVGGYGRIVFVDAHLPGGRQPLQCQSVRPEPLPAIFSHVLMPGPFLWLVRAVCGRTPEAFVVSMEGQSFETTHGLSPAAAGLVEEAAENVWRLLLGMQRIGSSAVTGKVTSHEN